MLELVASALILGLMLLIGLGFAGFGLSLLRDAIRPNGYWPVSDAFMGLLMLTMGLLVLVGFVALLTSGEAFTTSGTE